jgi:hypothetical protein
MWVYLGGLGMENVGIFMAIQNILSHLVYFVVIWYIFYPIWYIVRRKSWQPNCVCTIYLFGLN